MCRQRAAGRGLERAGAEKVPAGEQPTTVCALPLYHIFAFTVNMMLGMRTGKTILIPNPRDLPAVLKELSKHTFHSFPAVNTLFNGLANHPDFQHRQLEEPEDCGRRRHGGAERTGQAGWRRPVADLRRLRPVRNRPSATCNPHRTEAYTAAPSAAAAQHRMKCLTTTATRSPGAAG